MITPKANGMPLLVPKCMMACPILSGESLVPRTTDFPGENLVPWALPSKICFCEKGGSFAVHRSNKTSKFLILSLDLMHHEPVL